MHIVRTFGHLVGSILLVSGTSIGVGMLALPVATAKAGLLPALIVYVLCWLFMLSTGLLILEACVWMPKGANFITLTSRLLGKWGKATCWVLYLFLFICLMVTLVANGGDLVSQLSCKTLPYWLSSSIYVLVFAPIIYMGTLWVDRLNLILMLGLGILFLLFFFSCVSHVQRVNLIHMQWQKIWWAFPIVFTAFGYQCLIPTLYNYMNRNIAKVRTAIIIGTAIAFVIYTVWGLLTLGIVPCEAVQSIAQAIQNGTSFLDSPGSYLNSITMTTLGQAFCFFAMTTSFLGISLAFFDFLADGLKLRGKNRLHKSILCLSIFGLPLLVSWINPQLFLKILNLAGGFGVALLLGVIPILMIWAGRYFEGHSLLHQQLPGGKFTLSILAAFVIMVLIFTF